MPSASAFSWAAYCRQLGLLVPRSAADLPDRPFSPPAPPAAAPVRPALLGPASRRPGLRSAPLPPVLAVGQLFGGLQLGLLLRQEASMEGQHLFPFEDGVPQADLMPFISDPAHAVFERHGRVELHRWSVCAPAREECGRKLGIPVYKALQGRSCDASVRNFTRRWKPPRNLSDNNRLRMKNTALHVWPP